MLEELDATSSRFLLLAEWMAFDRIEEEAHKRAELAARAQQALNSYKRRGR